MSRFVTFSIASIEETEALAARLAGLLRSGDVVALHGDLGAGKTSFVRGILRALGHQGEVPSPTFSLVQQYETGSLEIWHFDFYRLESGEEVRELGIEDALASGVSLIEWPERAPDQLPADRLDVHIEAPPGGEEEARSFRFVGYTSWLPRLESLAA